MKAVFLVEASTGEYSDYVECKVAAFESQKAANQYVLELKKWLALILKQYGDDDDYFDGYLDGAKYDYDVQRLGFPPRGGHWSWDLFEHCQMMGCCQCSCSSGGLDFNVRRVPFLKAGAAPPRVKERP